MQTNIHGDWRIIRISESLLLVQVFDGWNEEAFVQFSKELAPEVRQMNGDKWAYIADAREWGLAVPDSQSSLEELYLGVTGLVCNVTVISSLVQKSVIDNMKTDEGKAIAPCYYSNTIADALDMAEFHGIEVDRAAVECWFKQGLSTSE